MSNEFSVYQFFNNDTHECVRSFVSAEEAMKAFQHYTNNVAVKLGLTARVIITDGGDSICAEWTAADGLVYPTPADLSG